jgi:crotonobetainyl-CoA:carnitine CoA-transferase CaiB-like acyl-CoA transferase
VGTASPYVAPSQVFEAADGPFTLAVVSDRHFRVLAESLGMPDLADTYPSNEVRMAERDALARKLTKVFQTEAADHWVSLLGEAGLPVGHVLTLNEALSDPQARHNEMIVEFEHPVAGAVRATGSPIHIDGAPGRAAKAPATLGQHTRPILREVGVDPESIEKMVAAGTAVVS